MINGWKWFISFVIVAALFAGNAIMRWLTCIWPAATPAITCIGLLIAATTLVRFMIALLENVGEETAPEEDDE